MKIAQKYSHLNGEEYLIVHHKNLYDEIIGVIEGIDAGQMKTSQDKAKKGKEHIDQKKLNKLFSKGFNALEWKESKYKYYVTTDRKLMQETINLPYDEQRIYLEEHGISHPLASYKQTDFVKNGVAIEVQFGKYSYVAFDLFVKHVLFYSGGLINVGIEILPTKTMQRSMDTGIAYFEGEVYNVLRHGRGNPPVPLLILGIEP